MAKKIDLSNKVTSQVKGSPSFDNMLERVEFCKSTKYRFICADIIFSEFKQAISKNEKTLRERSAPKIEDRSYSALCDFVLEAMWCSERIHHQLCLRHKDVEFAPNKKQLRIIIEKWASIHLRLWVLCVTKRLL